MTRELIAQAEALEQFAAQVDIAPDAVTPRLLSIALKQTARTYRAQAAQPPAEPVAAYQCMEGARCMCGGDTPAVRATCPNMRPIKPDPRIAEYRALLEIVLDEYRRHGWLYTTEKRIEAALGGK